MLTLIERHGFKFLVAEPSPIVLPPLPAPDVDYVPTKQAPRGSKKAEREALAAEKRARHLAKRAEAAARREQRERIEEWNPPAYIPEDIAEIQNAVMAEYGIKRGHFFGPSKREPIGTARIVSMALCRNRTDYNLEAIGAAHNRDHTSVCYAVGRFDGLMADEQIGQRIRKIVDNFSS